MDLRDRVLLSVRGAVRGRLAARASAGALLVGALAACGGPAGAVEGAASGWSAAAELPAPPADAPVRGVAVAADAAGGVHVLYLVDRPAESREPRLFHAARTDGAAPAALPLDDGRARIASPRLTVDGAGRVHAAWIAGEDPAEPRRLTHVVHRVLDAGRWSPAARVHREASEHGIQAPFLALRTDGRGRPSLLVARPDAGFSALTLDRGRWEAREDTAAAGGYAEWNAAGGDHADFVYVASELVPGERTAVNDVWYRPAAPEGWGEPIRVHGAPTYSLEPQLATDGGGTRHVVWREGDSPGRTDRLFHASAAPGEGWAPPRAFVPASAGAAVFAPRLAVDGRGVVHLAFLGVPESGEPRIYLARMERSAWHPLERFVPDPGPAGGPVSLAVDAAGAVHAVWRAADGRFRHAVYRP